MKIGRKELEIEPELKKKIEIISSFANQEPEFKNGSVVQIEKTNLVYVEPHTAIINHKKILFFNQRDDIFLNNLTNQYNLRDLEKLIKAKK